jgi:thiamine kinase
MIAEAILRAVPGRVGSVAPLAGGRHNRLTRIDTSAGSFVARERTRPLDPPGVDREREAAVQSAAALAGLAPGVIASDTSAGWLLMPFAAGERWSEPDFAAPASLLRLGRQLGRLHSLPVVAGHAFDALSIAQGQIARIRKDGVRDEALLTGALAELQELQPQLEALRRPLVMNHGDLDGANLLGAAPLLIDWEYAQLADPIYDIACILSYYPGARAHRIALLSAAGLDDPVSRQRLPLQLRQFTALNRLWLRAEEVCG